MKASVVTKDRNTCPASGAGKLYSVGCLPLLLVWFLVDLIGKAIIFGIASLFGKPMPSLAMVIKWTACAIFIPLATIIFEFLFCASAQGEDSKEKKGCGGRKEWKENPFVNFGTKAPQALRHGSADCPWSIRCRGYGFLRGRPGFLFGRASRAAFFGSTAGLKSGYFAM